MSTAWLHVAAERIDAGEDEIETMWDYGYRWVPAKDRGADETGRLRAALEDMARHHNGHCGCSDLDDCADMQTVIARAALDGEAGGETVVDFENYAAPIIPDGRVTLTAHETSPAGPLSEAPAAALEAIILDRNNLLEERDELKTAIMRIVGAQAGFLRDTSRANAFALRGAIARAEALAEDGGPG